MTTELPVSRTGATDREVEAVVRALREAADELESGGYEPAPTGGYPHFDCEDRVASWLRARAALLAEQPGGGR